MFRCSKIPQAYCNIARWEGPLGEFTMLKRTEGSEYGVKDGDVVKASMIGKILSVYINGVQIISSATTDLRAIIQASGITSQGPPARWATLGFQVLWRPTDNPRSSSPHAFEKGKADGNLAIRNVRSRFPDAFPARHLERTRHRGECGRGHGTANRVAALASGVGEPPAGSDFTRQADRGRGRCGEIGRKRGCFGLWHSQERPR